MFGHPTAHVRNRLTAWLRRVFFGRLAFPILLLTAWLPAQAQLRIDGFAPPTGGMGTIITIVGGGFGNNPDNICAIIMNDDLAIPLEVLTATDAQITARLGPVTPAAKPGPIGVALGRGNRAHFKPLFPDAIVLEPAWVWTRTPQGPEVLSTQLFTPIPTAVAGKFKPAGNPNGQPRWFFSGPPTNGMICLLLDGNWPAPSKIRVQARAHDHQRGIGRDLEAYCIELPGGGTLMDCAARICDTIRCAFMQQGMVAVNCTATQVPGANQVKLTLSMPDGRIGWGNLNVCVEPGQPPPPPVVLAVDPTGACEGQVINILGGGFGNNPDNICAVIMLPDQRSIPLEVLTTTSNRITARLGALPPDLIAGNAGQVMVGLGDGQRGTFRPAFFDIFVEDPVWVWKKTGPAATAPQPFALLQCPTPTNRCCFFSQPPTTTDGKLCLILDKPWPAHSKVRIEARAHDHQQGIGRDLRAICVQFGAPVPPGGAPGPTNITENILACAHRICDVIVCAFRQQANLEVSCRVEIDPASGHVKLTLSLPDGRIHWGNFNVCFEEIPAPMAPVITSVTPEAGQVGDVIVIRGSGFGNCADNLCAVVMDGDLSHPLQVIRAQDDMIQAVVRPVRPGARPGPIMIGLGRGHVGRFRPAFFDVFVADDVWAWERQGGAAMSPRPFRPIPTPAPPQQQWFFSGPPVDGVLCLFLTNAWPASAKITIQARAHDHDKGIGRDLTAYELHFNGGGSLLDCAHRICDSISCAFMQQGNLAVFCNVQLLTNGSVKITLGLPDGKVGWGNLNVCVQSMAPPPQQVPVVLGVTPTSGGEGTLVTVRGTNFPTDPNDICMVAMGAPGTPNAMLSHPFEVISSSATQVVGRLAAVSPGPHQAGPIMIGRGAGQRGFFQPILPGIDVTQPVWTWNRNGNPAGMGGTFQPTPNQPNPSNVWFFSGPPMNGMLMVQIAGNWPANSVITIQARAHDHDQGIGHDLSAINIVFTGGGTLDDCAAKLCDSTRCAFLQAGMNVFCQVISNGVTARKLVMTIPGGNISWGNFNICVSGPPLPNPPPVIAAVSPLQGPPGTLVTVRGTNFPTDPDDVCLVHMGFPGTANEGISIPFEVISSSVTQVVGRLGVVPPDAQPGPIMLGRGRGQVGTPMFAFFDVFAELPVWTWQKTGPAGQSPPTQLFRPIPAPPPPSTTWFFSGPPTANGELCVFIQGTWPSPAKIEIQARAHDHQRRIGRDLRAICIRFDGNGTNGTILDCAYRICDVIRCAFRQQANLEVECRVELVTDATGLPRVKLTLSLPDGFINWGNFNICVTPATPPAPAIFDVNPLAGREGDIIRVRGTNFPTDPNDICLVQMGQPGTPAGALSTPLEVLTASPTELTARLGPIDPQARPGPLMVAVGEGSTGFFRPAFFDVFVEEPTWVWKLTGPAAQGLQTFTPQPSGTPGTWFYSGPPTTDGKLCVTLSGNWTAQSKIRIEARAHDHQRKIGRDLRSICVRLPAGGSPFDCAARICDVIRCAFMQQAGILVNCTVEPSGGNVKLTLSLPEGSISWGNFNICVLNPTAVPVPVAINGVLPQQGGEGEVITITGTGFGNNPNNICAVVMNGGNAIPLEVLTTVSNRITARLGPVPPDAVPGQVMVGLGQGNKGRFRPAFFDVFVADDVWTWNRNGGPMANAPGTFRPLPTPPPPNTRWFFSGPPTNGVLCLYLHGNWPDPSKIRIQARAHNHATGQGKDLEAYCLEWGSFSMMGTGGVMVSQMDLLGCALRICDSIACAFWQQAHIQVNCEVFPIDDDTVKMVLSLPDGRIDWGNFNVCVEPANGDPGPEVEVEPVAAPGGPLIVNVCWPLSRTDFFLQAVDRLNRPIPWQPAPLTPHAEGNLLKVPVPVAIPPPPGLPPHRFFRLFRTPPLLNNPD